MHSHAPATPGLTEIGQIAVAVRDLPRAVAFYRDTLGLPFLFETNSMAFFDCGGVRLMLSRPEKPEFDHPASIIYYRVRHIEESAAVLRSRGVSFEAEPHIVARLPHHDLWMAFLKDPEGNVFALMADVERS
jgi:catechol 2,3-dioxygenase-like lactoylglutathione lyase family enzyme